MASQRPTAKAISNKADSDLLAVETSSENGCSTQHCNPLGQVRSKSDATWRKRTGIMIGLGKTSVPHLCLGGFRVVQVLSE